MKCKLCGQEVVHTPSMKVPYTARDFAVLDHSAGFIIVWRLEDDEVGGEVGYTNVNRMADVEAAYKKLLKSPSQTAEDALWDCVAHRANADICENYGGYIGRYVGSGMAIYDSEQKAKKARSPMIQRMQVIADGLVKKYGKPGKK